LGLRHTLRLTENEWAVYQNGLRLFLESERFVRRTEFHTIMGTYPEELRTALDQSVVQMDGGGVELPKDLVKEFVKLIGLFFLSYPFSNRAAAEIETRIGLREEQLLILKGDLRVRLGLRRKSGPPPTGGV